MLLKPKYCHQMTRKGSSLHTNWRYFATSIVALPIFLFCFCLFFVFCFCCFLFFVFIVFCFLFFLGKYVKSLQQTKITRNFEKFPEGFEVYSSFVLTKKQFLKDQLLNDMKVKNIFDSLLFSLHILFFFFFFLFFFFLFFSNSYGVHKTHSAFLIGCMLL